ncbi:MAG: carboxypeptidase regulatory-like domain-containing protein [Candidatus Acidiferrales bacterium]
MNFRRLIVVAFALLALVFLDYQPALAQSTIATGSIQGSVTDPQGAAVPDAKIAISSKDTGEIIDLQSTSSGVYNTGGLKPGTYTVRVEAPNFKTTQVTLSVQIGSITTGNVKLELGASSTVVEVTGQEVAVNTEQVQVQGVLGTDQIENLPTNGRNFLDLAQLEPGVQIQDGQNFDPTKAGFSSISFGGRFGRTARIEVDGVDVSDETVGTTTTDIPSSAIQEFQISQSSLDLSNELTSSGAINIVTRSGTNTLHGEAYGAFRDSADGLAARLPGPPGAVPGSFERSQYGGNVGGPVIKDKFFFFLDGERTIQAENASLPFAAPFTALSGVFPAPFHEMETMAKADYQATKSLHLFYRFSYFQAFTAASFGYGYSAYGNKDRTRNHVLGADFNTGQFTHSFRFEYLKFQNNIADAVVGSSLPYASLGVSLLFTTNGFGAGPNLLAPQETPQSDHQFKYDGSKVWGSHILRYGVSFNHIQGGGYADFFGIAPLDENVLNDLAAVPFSSNGASDPLNYIPDVVIMGNNQGFSTEKPAFGFKEGGLGPDNRLGLYVGDSWKIKPNLTLTYGVRYVRDTGRTDSDQNTVQSLNSIVPGIGDPVQQPNHNFGPQVGLAWDPWSTGKTVFRAGIGEYFENVIYNNVLFDRPLRITQGVFLDTPTACLFGSEIPVQFPTGNESLPPGTCSESIGASAATIAAFQTAFQAASASATAGPNPNYLPTKIASGTAIPTGFYAPNYKTPRSIQMNAGMQREIAHGMVLSVDYLRNVSMHYLLSVDVNHSGDVNYFNPAAAQAAVAKTNAFFGCGASASAAATNCAIASHVASPTTGAPGANIGDYAGNGLDSANDLGVGGCQIAEGFQCAFGGINPTVGAFPLLEPIGKGVYNGLDVKLVQNLSHPMPGVKHLNFQVSYSLSRFDNDGGWSSTAPGAPGTADQDFVIQSMDNRNPQQYFGESTLDRTNQLSFGGYADLPFWFRVGVAAHFWSALPNTLFAAGSAGTGAGSIFQTDYTGDGTTQDPLPGTHLGSFGRGISAGDLPGVVNNFNSTYAGQLTPAGVVLTNNQIFTKAQLQAIGGDIPTIPSVVPGNIGMGDTKGLDLKVSWEGKFFNERLVVEPSVALFNIFNFANYDPPGDTLSGLLNATPGVSLNDVTKNGFGTNHTNQIGVGTGVFSLGAPRVAEFGLKFTF